MNLKNMALGAVIAATVAAGACSATRAANEPAAGSGDPAVPASVLAQLRAAVTSAERVPVFTPPGPAVSASVLHGRTVLVMPVNSQIDACSAQARDFSALGAQLGMHVTMFADSGLPTQWVAGIGQAVSSRDSALVMLCGIIPGAVAPQLAAARSAGIAVVDGNYNETQNYAGLDGETAVSVAQGMTDDVDQAIVNLNGRPLHALLLTSSEIVQGPAAQAAVQAAVRSACPKVCTVDKTMDIPVQNWGAATTQSDVTSALDQYPGINAVIVAFDGMTTEVIPGVQAAHRAGVKIYTWGASRSVESMMLKPGSIVAANPGPDEQWDAYEAMDQVIRLLGGQPAAPVSREVAPNRFWVPANVSAFFGPGGTYGNKGYGGDAFISGFGSLWRS